MIRKILGPLFFVVLFNLVALGVLLVLPPWLGIVWALLLGTAFLWWHARHTPGRAERLERVRMRAPNASLVSTALVCASTLLCLLGITGLIAVFGTPLQPSELRMLEPLRAYQKTLPGWIAFTTLITLVIPMVEEFNFRGRIQNSLQMRYGLIVALAVTSLLFAVTHIGVPRSAILLIPLTLAVANGIAVVLFNSIWVAVATHSLWNGLVAVLGKLKASAVSGYTGVNSTSDLAFSAVVLVLGIVGWLVTTRRHRSGVQPDR